MRCKHFLF